MGMLSTIALRLSTVRQLKARRTELLLQKAWLLEEERALIGGGLTDEAADYWSSFLSRKKARLNAQLDAVNNEIGRRGGR